MNTNKITDLNTLNEFISLSDEEKRVLLNLHKAFKTAVTEHAEEHHSTTMLNGQELLWLKQAFQEDTAWGDEAFTEAYEEYRVFVQELVKKGFSDTWNLGWEEDYLQAQEERRTA